MVDQRFRVSVEHFEWSWSVGEGRLRMTECGDGRYRWWNGEFCDARGIATVYRQSDLTRIDFVAHGKVHSRIWKAYFGDRTISRLARAFITDLVGEPHP